MEGGDGEGEGKKRGRGEALPLKEMEGGEGGIEGEVGKGGMGKGRSIDKDAKGKQGKRLVRDNLPSFHCLAPCVFQLMKMDDTGGCFKESVPNCVFV